MRRPSLKALATAAEWLDAYEGADDDDNGRECRAVAAWLRSTIDAAQLDAEVRRLAKERGYGPAQVRKAQAIARRELLGARA